MLVCASAGIAPNAAAQTPPSSSQSQAAPPSDNSDSSVAAAARKTKAQKTSANAKVFTDEDMDAFSGPLPRLKLEGPDNTGDVMDAISKYRAAHTPEQTEQAIHTWYDRYDQMLVALINQDRNMNAIRNVNANNTYDLCQESEDPRSCQYSQRTSVQSTRYDSTVMMKNSNLERRLQDNLFRISAGLLQSNLLYSWFKLRNPDGSEIPNFPFLQRSR